MLRQFTDDVWIHSKRINSEVKKSGTVIEGTERVVSLSIGIASYPIRANDATELFKAADKALKEREETGFSWQLRW